MKSALEEKKDDIVRDARGTRIKYKQEKTQFLDAYARLVAAEPYSSVIHSSSDNVLYICTPGKKKPIDIEGLKLHVDMFLSAKEDEISSAKLDFFIYALKTNNAIAAHIGMETIKKLEKESDGDPTINNLRKAIFSADSKKIEEFKELINEQIVVPYFDQFLSDKEVDYIRSVVGKISKIQEILNDSQVHVEAFAVYSLLQEMGYKDFFIGLAQSNGDRAVGCCGACCIDFREMTKKEGINIYRTADYPASIIPSNKYKPAYANEALLGKKQFYYENVDFIFLKYQDCIDGQLESLGSESSIQSHSEF